MWPSVYVNGGALMEMCAEEVEAAREAEGLSSPQDALVLAVKRYAALREVEAHLFVSSISRSDGGRCVRASKHVHVEYTEYGALRCAASGVF